MSSHRPEPESFLPLTPQAFHLLVSLAEGDQHGWAILKRVARRTGNRIRLSPGTLYGLVKRLQRQGLIAESSRRPPEEWDDERRRYYQLTDLGRRVVRAEMDRMEEALAAAGEVPSLHPEPDRG